MAAEQQRLFKEENPDYQYEKAKQKHMLIKQKGEPEQKPITVLDVKTLLTLPPEDIKAYILFFYAFFSLSLGRNVLCRTLLCFNNCIGNLKQIGLGASMYANDYRQYIPIIPSPNPWGVNGNLPSRAQLSTMLVPLGYLPFGKVISSSFSSGTDPSGGSAVWALACPEESYWLNSIDQMGPHHKPVIIGFESWTCWEWGTRQDLQRQDVPPEYPNAPTTVSRTRLAWRWEYDSRLRSGGGSPVLFLDGHVVVPPARDDTAWLLWMHQYK